MNRKTLLFLLLALAIAWSGNMLLAQTVVADDSDASFTILAQMVTVISLNGGENFYRGALDTITRIISTWAAR